MMNGKYSGTSSYTEYWLTRQFSDKINLEITDTEMLMEIFHSLARTEECVSIYRDEIGNWPWCLSESAKSGTLDIPIIDNKIDKWLEAHNGVSRKKIWPKNSSFALCLTHDVDFISRRQISAKFILELISRCRNNPDLQIGESIKKLLKTAIKFIAGPVFKIQKEDEYHKIDKCIQIEVAHDFKSTFFFIAEHLISPNILDCGYSFSERLEYFGENMTVRDVMRNIHARNWEVGHHGSYNSATNITALLSEKQQLEKALGARITSTRQHYLHYDMRITPSLHEKAGFLADSTHGYNRSTGFRAGTSFPYNCWDYTKNQFTNVIEVPLHIMDVSLFHADSMHLDETSAYAHIIKLMDCVELVGGCLSLNWHPCWLSIPKYINVYAAVLEEAKHRGAWGATVKDIVSHWKQI